MRKNLDITAEAVEALTIQAVCASRRNMNG